MGVYVKNMKMPKNCLTCYCTDSEYGECVLDPEKRCPEDYGKRAEWCPLVPVPPHGDLIDASEKIRVQMYDDEHEDFHTVEMTIDDLLGQGWVEADAPTVIPAEEGERWLH